MTPDALKVGAAYPGDIPDHDAAIFEFSKAGPELRLFYSGMTDDAVRAVQTEDCYLGLLRSQDIAVVPWRIGSLLGGDAQFHVFLYPPETRPTPEILNDEIRYEVCLILVDRESRMVLARRRLRLSSELSKLFNEAIAYQHGSHIGREEYDAQVSIYQDHYPNVKDAIAAAPRFEKMEPCHEERV